MVVADDAAVDGVRQLRLQPSRAASAGLMSTSTTVRPPAVAAATRVLRQGLQVPPDREGIGQIIDADQVSSDETRGHRPSAVRDQIAGRSRRLRHTSAFRGFDVQADTERSRPTEQRRTAVRRGHRSSGGRFLPVRCACGRSTKLSTMARHSTRSPRRSSSAATRPDEKPAERPAHQAVRTDAAGCLQSRPHSRSPSRRAMDRSRPDRPASGIATRSADDALRDGAPSERSRRRCRSHHARRTPAALQEPRALSDSSADGVAAAAGARAVSASRARIVGFCRRSRSLISMPKVLSCRSRATTLRLRIELPPSSKKLSVTPTCGSLRMSAHRRAIAISAGRSAGRRSFAHRRVGLGQRTPVDLSARHDGQTLQHDDPRRHHVGRQASASGNRSICRPALRRRRPTHRACAFGAT